MTLKQGLKNDTTTSNINTIMNQHRHRYSATINRAVKMFEAKQPAILDTQCFVCGMDYDAADYLLQSCSKCGFDNKK